MKVVYVLALLFVVLFVNAYLFSYSRYMAKKVNELCWNADKVVEIMERVAEAKARPINTTKKFLGSSSELPITKRFLKIAIKKYENSFLAVKQTNQKLPFSESSKSFEKLLMELDFAKKEYFSKSTALIEILHEDNSKVINATRAMKKSGFAFIKKANDIQQVARYL
jgi:hypothetical protein